LLAVWETVDLTDGYHCLKSLLQSLHMQSPIRPTRGDAMSKHPKTTKPDSSVDAWAILFIILLAVGAAVFWVSGR